MGTVGLSFGSATSGAGFDVASTVTSILAISSAIETPWKTQLDEPAGAGRGADGAGDKPVEPVDGGERADGFRRGAGLEAGVEFGYRMC